MANDRKQQRLRRLFEELRHIKQHWLPERMPDPVSQAIHEEDARRAIREIEERIEEEMNAQEQGV